MLCLIHFRILQNALPDSALSWEFCYMYFRWSIYSSTAPEWYLIFYWYVCAYYNGVCIDMFVHLITVSVLLCLWMLYNLPIGYTSYWYFVISISDAYISPPLRHRCICVCINVFVSVISMVTAKCLCTSYNLILGCATSWASCHAYLL